MTVHERDLRIVMKEVVERQGNVRAVLALLTGDVKAPSVKKVKHLWKRLSNLFICLDVTINRKMMICQAKHLAPLHQLVIMVCRPQIDDNSYPRRDQIVHKASISCRRQRLAPQPSSEHRMKVVDSYVLDHFTVHTLD